MPPQQGDNEEEAAPNKSGPGSKGGADDSDDEDVTTVRVVHRKGKGADDDALVVSPAVAVEEDGVEAELRATKAMAHYCFGERGELDDSSNSKIGAQGCCWGGAPLG